MIAKKEYQLQVVQSRICNVLSWHTSNVIPIPYNIIVVASMSLSLRVIIFIMIPFVLIQQTKVVKDCTSNSDFVGKWNFYYPAVSPVYASDFVTFQKRTLLLPWRQTKLYWKLFPLDLSLLQEMVFEARRQVGMRCLHLDGVWYHYPQFTQNHLSESDRALQDQILYYFVELSHHAYCLESQMQSQGSVSCHRQ